MFHAVTIGTQAEQIDGAEIVRRTTRRCLQLLWTLNLTSIAFPAIGSGAAGFKYEDVASNMDEVICDEAVKLERSIEVTIYLFDRFGTLTTIDFVRFFEECAARVPRLRPLACGVVQTPTTELRSTQVASLAEATPQDVRAHRLHGLSKLISSLEDHRLKIEEDLIAALAGNDEDQTIKARKRLKENEELRFGYYRELKAESWRGDRGYAQ